jgi:hypothetical protein
MKITLEMPVVSECLVRECAYNKEDGCHARAITIGDDVHPGCDTFLDASPHARNTRQQAGVGACKVSACQHNDDYECSANAIYVGYDKGEVCCLSCAM